MQLDIFNINDFISANKCPEIKNPIFWNSNGAPTEDGLFSYELFGYSDEDRKNIFGYIDLHGNYIHPIIYLIMRTKMGSLGKILNCEKYAVVADKKIKIVDPSFDGAETGIDFIYNNFENINWIDVIEEDDIESLDKKTRLKFLKSLKKEEFFVNKWLVLPPFYRAESSVNRSMGDNINKLYKDLISKTRSMDLGFSFDIFGSETKLRIQNLLKDIYLSTLAPISGKNLIMENGVSTLAGTGKNSMIRKHLLGKNIDWSASSVITAPKNSSAERPEDKPVPFGYSAYPLAILLSLFQPFYLNWCADFLESILVNMMADNKTPDNIKIKSFNRNQFSVDVVEKMIKGFIKNPEERYSPIYFSYVCEDNEEYEDCVAITEYKTEEDFKNGQNGIRRPLTYIDLFFIASTVILKDKHVYTTRYPVLDYQNIYPSKIKILTTAKTREIYLAIGNSEIPMHFKDYPYILNSKGTNKLEAQLYDVTICGNIYLSGMDRGLRWGHNLYAWGF